MDVQGRMNGWFGGEGRRGVVALLRERARTLVAVAVVAAVLAVPIALASPVYSSEVRVLVPAEDVVSTGFRQASVLALAVDGYARSALAADVRERLAPAVGDAVSSISAVQLRDEDIYVVAVDASSPEAATEAATQAGATLLARSIEMAEEQVEGLRADVDDRLTEFNERLVRIEDQLRVLSADAKTWRQALQRGNKQRPAGWAARAADLHDRLDAARVERTRLEGELGIADDKRDALGTLLAGAEKELITYGAVATMVSGPTAPRSGTAARLLVTVLLAVLAALAVAIAVLLVLARRASTRVDAAAASESDPEDVATKRGWVGSA